MARRFGIRVRVDNENHIQTTKSNRGRQLRQRQCRERVMATAIVRHPFARRTLLRAWMGRGFHCGPNLF